MAKIIRFPVREQESVAYGNYRVGWNEYRVTDRAFDKLKEQYTISQRCYLD